MIYKYDDFTRHETEYKHKTKDVVLLTAPVLKGAKLTKNGKYVGIYPTIQIALAVLNGELDIEGTDTAAIHRGERRPKVLA